MEWPMRREPDSSTGDRISDRVGGPEHIDVVANFPVVRTTQDGEMTISGAARYVDRVMRDADCWKFASKTVVLDSRQVDTLLAIPGAVRNGYAAPAKYRRRAMRALR